MSNKPIQVAISGKSGCGNSSVSKILSRRLGFNLINYTFHNIAQEKGLDFKQLCLMAETDTSWDLYLDQKQQDMAAAGNCILGSRLAIWLLKKADLKVYLTASPAIRATRILGREGGDEALVAREVAERDLRDHERYLRLYQIDNDAYDFADLVIDTETLSLDQEAQVIIDCLLKKHPRLKILD